ncbi:MAG: GNAT family N-acetyltransferase [candidate division Zixibacteria bacterium]|nr:GNAT family N-acetyltransferase [candidate division Zixibacteria bacterium]MDH3936567.1 GNAT family N-acetyltransferase [candidate division Zixibacteria bacterium]MDH4033924.1 GNAT family N-acetyltransferase [candidate division Zixibacteria bacterium]
MMERNQMRDLEFIRSLERIEVAAWSDFHRAATVEVAVACGVDLLPIDNVCAAAASKVNVLAFNRVIGLGLRAPTSTSDLFALIAQYKQRGVPRFFIQACLPVVGPGLVASIEEAGLYHYNNWVKLYRAAEPIPKFTSDLEVLQITTEHAEAFGQIVVDSFEWPQPLVPWVASSIGRPGWRHYIAFDGDTPVATAAAFFQEECAWIDFAATLPDYRGRGGQAALLAQRAIDATDLGCKWLVVETAEQTAEQSAPSYRNMVRYGFEVAYIRPNYLFTADTI